MLNNPKVINKMRNFLYMPHTSYKVMDFPGGSDGKASACNAGDPGLIPGSGRSHGEGNGSPLSTLAWKIPWMEEPDRLQSMGSQSRTQLSDFTFTFFLRLSARNFIQNVLDFWFPVLYIRCLEINTLT